MLQLGTVKLEFDIENWATFPSKLIEKFQYIQIKLQATFSVEWKRENFIQALEMAQTSFILDDWRNSVIEIGKVASISLIFNHPKWNPCYSWFF